ncbi:MAG: hypothetical protein ACSLFQ_07930 [Thermoanaerobaculia bacterium]
MLIRMNQKGEGRMGCIFGLLILAVACFVAYKLIPPKIQAAEMRDVIQDEARSASGRGSDSVKKSILARAEELKVPLDPENCIVERRADFIRVEVEYTVDIPFPGYLYKKTYKFSTENPVF